MKMMSNPLHDDDYIQPAARSQQATTTPLLELHNVSKSFTAGDTQTQVLFDISLKIYRGEMVAIVGASGSGKSSLMNIIGCLDIASSGSYKISGKETKKLNSDELSTLRRNHFGFIFQRYHLIPHLTAAENVEIPALYNGIAARQRHARSAQLLDQFGLGHKLTSKPNQLSGGQQQRVSICRALMNQADVILADEPTGALDKQSGHDVLRILKQLHQQGKTIIIITHDLNIAEMAERVITIDDGRIMSDNGSPRQQKLQQLVEEVSFNKGQSKSKAKTDWQSIFHNVWRSITAKPLRTFLTMLGIMIGTAAVISIEAIGTGAKDAALYKIRSLSSNTLYLYPGREFGDENDIAVQLLTPHDLEALQRENYIDSITPVTSRNIKVRTEAKENPAILQGVGQDYFRVRDFTVIEGRTFSKDDITHFLQNVVIDKKTRDYLFEHDNAIGQRIVINNQPAIVIGVVDSKPGLFASEDKTLRIWTSYSAGIARWFGSGSSFDQFIIRFKEGVPAYICEEGIKNVMLRQHGTEDFSMYNADAVLKTTENVSQMLALMLVSIAIVALIVGGIGVMNIMLVSVVERTQEIGIRMAVGARRRDIQQQFLVESVLLCLLGGCVGLLLARTIGAIFSLLVEQITPVFSINTMLMAFISSSLIGILFGFFPARRASMLHPSLALTRE